MAFWLTISLPFPSIHFPPPSSTSSRICNSPWNQTGLSSRRHRASASSLSGINGESGGKFMDFPYASPPVRDLMVDLVSTVESRLESQLLPCTLPPDVQRYQDDSSSSHASLHVRSGISASPIDFILGSWLNCPLPTGATLNISSLSCYLNESTDAPHFLIELIQTSTTSIVLILDLPPRKDLVLHADYLKTFYEDSELDKHRQLLEKIPEVRPYLSPSLYVRCAVSPTAILVRIETKATSPERFEEIMLGNVSVIAKEVLGIWLGSFLNGKREVEEVEKVYLKKRDLIFKSKIIEIDLGSNLPRLFGQETAARVLEALRDVFSL